MSRTENNSIATPPLVSVILPAYNAERHIEEAVRSILTQSFADFELLVIDDGSTDRTVERIKKIADPRLRLLENGVNRGIVFSLNRGIDGSRGRYIARMDADDISLPRRLEKQVLLMDARPEVGLCGSWATKFFPFGPRWLQKAPEGSAALKAELLFATPFVHPSVMMRRSLLDREGLRYEDGYQTAEDYRLWGRMALVTELAVIPEVLLRYRVGPASVTGAVFLDEDRRARRRRALRKIWADYLRETLGSVPDDEQLDTHALFYEKRVAGERISSGDMVRAVAWAALLREWNAKSRFFDEMELKAVVERELRRTGRDTAGDLMRRTIMRLARSR